MADEMLLRFREVSLQTGLSRSTVDRLEKQGRFPRRVQLGDRTVAWRSSDINAWIKALNPPARAQRPALVLRTLGPDFSP